MKPCTVATPRIKNLRNYYMNHSQMVINRDTVPWRCFRSLDLYVDGWIKNAHAPTLRMRRSYAEAYSLSEMLPVICEGELIVGQPDFTPYTPDEEKKHEEYQKLHEHIIPRKMGRADHVALDYEKLVRVGINGLISEVQEKQSNLDLQDGQTAEEYELYTCIITELNGLLKLAENYSDYAQKLSENASCKRKAEYLKLAQVLKNVPANPASTFREALQCIHFFTFSLFGIYSMGRPDQYLLPYYEKDIKEGIMTEQEAQELIDCFCLQYMNNMSAWAAAGFMLGGRDKNGKAVENQLTWHFLAAIEHVNAPDPNVGICITEETSQELLDYVVILLKEGFGNPQIWNNDAITASLVKYGFDPSASNLFTHSTCVEITPIGCSGISITSPYINMLSIFLDTIHKLPDDVNFEDLFECYTKDFRAYCNQCMLRENLSQLERARNATDPVRISALIHDCLKRGLSSENEGAVYNQLEPNMLGMANVIESLSIIWQLVYKKHIATLSEMKHALQRNYVGYEALYQTIKSDPSITHFGMGDPETNALAKRVSDMVLETFSKYRTFRGADVIPGSFSYREHILQGEKTKASPDGRLAGQPLASGSSPVQGYELLGPTVSLCSTNSWEPVRFLGGTATNIKLPECIPAESIKQLIIGFLKTEIAQMQFNIVSTQTLKDAQEHPENHKDLIVRIGGYSDYFVRIPKNMQDEVISRNQN